MLERIQLCVAVVVVVDQNRVHRDHMWVTTTTIKDSRQLLVSKSRLKFIVKTHSFKGGKLKLRCLANIHNVYSQAIELDIEEEKPRLNSDATQVVILPSNFLEKKSEAETQNRNHNGKEKRLNKK
ncbi:hypothetical protein RUM44_011957 [Polyplax serrata]|uniref:Uncharacterized protein n=1 Tax=Polyplax serrata TaxID=468196 RepID=A0ABR1B9Z2_POLSC